jgi:hypothetical protein
VIEFGELELVLPLLLLEPQAAASAARPTLRTNAPARLLTVPRLFIGFLFRAGALAGTTPSADTVTRRRSFTLIFRQSRVDSLIVASLHLHHQASIVQQ